MDGKRTHSTNRAAAAVALWGGRDILDSDLKTEYDNLYVCDCSVIPEAWGLPPTLTIIALGKRLAKHLSAESNG